MRFVKVGDVLVNLGHVAAIRLKGPAGDRTSEVVFHDGTKLCVSRDGTSTILAAVAGVDISGLHDAAARPGREPIVMAGGVPEF